jgi:RND family efflux transporter MFP subunit
MKTSVLLKIAGLVLPAALAITGCSRTTSAAKPAPPPDVEVYQVDERNVPIYGEWIGTLEGLVNADIKAQVSGYMLKQAYTEGSFVRTGQLLFEIDPRPFQAAVDQAQGQLAQAQGQVAQSNAQLGQAEAQLAVAKANQGRTQLDVDRYAPLAKEQAVTQQELDNATQNNLAAKAQVQSATAAVETARAQILAANAAVQAANAAVEQAKLNLGFTRLVSPIDGIVGTARQQVGSLVNKDSGAITTVSTVDPIKVVFTLGEQEYMDFNRRFSTEARRQQETRRLQLDLVLADGTTYPRPGKFYFADREVDPKTGAIRISGLFPNPGNMLRPGQYGKVRSATRTHQGALLVPQRAVTELQGNYQVAVVDAQNKVSIRNVKIGDRQGTMWIIADGLKPGERIVVEGIQKVGPGAEVNPKPFRQAKGS